MEIISLYQNFFSDQPINVVFFALAIAGLGVSIWGALRASRDKVPCWYAKNIDLIRGNTSSIPGMKVTVNGEPVPSVSVARIAFWNRGKETINGDDIADADKLRVEMGSNVRFLGASIYTTTNDASEPRVFSGDESLNCVYMDFDYLDYRNGFVVQIVHSGGSLEDFEVKGSIKGAKHKSPRNVTARRSIIMWTFTRPSRRTRNKIINGVFVANALVMTYLAIHLFYGMFLDKHSTFQSRMGAGYFLVMIVFVIVIGGITLNMLWLSYRVVWPPFPERLVAGQGGVLD